MGMSRIQFAKLIGYKPTTVKKYEWTNPSGKYTEWCKKVIRRHFKSVSDK